MKYPRLKSLKDGLETWEVRPGYFVAAPTAVLDAQDGFCTYVDSENPHEFSARVESVDRERGVVVLKVAAANFSEVEAWAELHIGAATLVQGRAVEVQLPRPPRAPKHGAQADCG